MITNILTLSIFAIIQVAMMLFSTKINYKLDRRHIAMGLIINPVCNYLLIKGYGVNIVSILLLIITTILITSSLIDMKYQELPDSYNLLVAILGIVLLVVLHYQYGISLRGLIPNIITAVGLFVGFLLMSVISGGALGGGDIKLMGAVGLLFHYSQIPQILMYSFTAGALYSIVMLALKKKKKDDKFAFGPFLVMGVILTLIIQL